MLKRSILVSGSLHAGIIVAASLVFPSAIAFPEDDDTNVVPVELVSITPVTNVAPTVQDQLPPPPVPAVPEPPAPPAPPAPEPELTPPPPPPPEVTPPEPDPVPEPPPPPEVAVETPPPPPPPPKPLANVIPPRRKPAPAPKPAFDIDSVIAGLEKRAPRTPPPANAKPAETTVKGLGAQTALTADVKDALLSQMRACWNVPVGAPNPEQLIVQVRVFLAKDGRLAQPPQLEPATRAAVAGNAYLRTAAEAALRAVNVCEPYQRLPVENYDSWREIVMTFDPSKMTRR